MPRDTLLEEDTSMFAGPIQQALRTRPFQPFRIVQTDGTAYEVHHPDWVWLANTYAIVGLHAAQPVAPNIFGPPDPNRPDIHVTIDLLHIQRLEPLPTPAAPPGNGQGQ
jgi:hypothetical protein